jgi:hypothetical protein
MPRVVPSQVVAVIDQAFPFAATQQEGQRVNSLSIHRSAELSALIELIERIPDELLRLEGTDFLALIGAVAGIRDILAVWRSNRPEDWVLDTIRGFGDVNPVTLIRRCLVKCPDEAPSFATTELAFVRDPDLRDSIRLDISDANRDLTQGEWKGATVLAGSAVEALLLWALQGQEKQKSGALATAVAALRGDGTLTRQPDPNPERWDLHEYVEVARFLDFIEDDTAKLIRLAKGFRNLIHPGRAARLGQKCDRGTALTALAAVEGVARDLTP